MVALDPETIALGIVTCTTGRAVGSAVPHAEEGVGAIATQANTNVLHGSHGLRLLKMGFTPSEALKSSLALDKHFENRQVLIIDSKGRKAVHTGSLNSDWKGHVCGDHFIAAGNNIVGPEILEAMVKTYNESLREPIYERLLRVIQSGEDAGGCNWPDHTAALKVVGVEDEMKIFSRPVLDLRVDSSTDPTGDLRKLFNEYRKFIQERREKPANIRGFLQV